MERFRLIVAADTRNGCRVLYDVGPYALVILPGGNCYRGRVGTGEVPLTIVPPDLNREWIDSRQLPFVRLFRDRVVSWPEEPPS